MTMTRALTMLWALGWVLWAGLGRPAAAAPIPIAAAKDHKVDFEKEILPIFQRSCLACHNASQAESELVLETPQMIHKGGSEGPVVVPGKADQSRLLALAAHQKEPVMPPEDNDRKAPNLSSGDLGLLKLWIDQGATGSVTGAATPIQWQPLPPSLNPIMAVAMTTDGQYVACGRGSRIHVYQSTTGRLVSELVDPALLAGGAPLTVRAAHLDMVQSLAFSPDGNLLVSGGFREIKFWRRTTGAMTRSLAGAVGPTTGAVAVSQDGRWLATGAGDNTIKIWDLASGQLARSLTGHSAAISSLAFSADDATLVSASIDQSLRLWKVADGSPMGRIDAPAAINAVALLANARLASGGADNLVRLWKLPGPVRSISVPGATTVAASPDRKQLAIATSDGKIVLVDAATGQPGKTLAGHEGTASRIAFSGDGKRIASAGADKTARLWDVEAGQAVLSIALAEPASAMAVNPAGTRLASGFANGAISVWKLDTPAPRALAGDDGAVVTVAVQSPDAKLLATAGISQGKPAILVREIASGNVTRTLLGHDGPVSALAFSGDSARLISGSADKTARVWNLADSKEIAKFTHAQQVTGAALSSNGQQAASGSADKSLKQWNVADGKEIRDLPGHGGPVVAVAMTANDQQIVSASADQTVRIWNAGNGQQIRSLPTGSPPTALALARDNSKVAVAAADKSIKIFQLSDGKQLAAVATAAGPAGTVAFSVDGTRLVAASGGLAHVWETAAGAVIEWIPLPAGASFAAFGPALDTVVLGTSDKKIHVHTLRHERSITGHAGKVTGLVYASNGQTLHSAGEDGIIRGFDVSNGQARFSANHGAPVLGLAQSPDGQLLASAGRNNEARVWNASNGSPHRNPQLAGLSAPASAISFSGDGQRVIVGTEKPGEVVAFRIDTQGSAQAEQAFREQPAGTAALAAIGESGSVVATAASDGSIRLWELCGVGLLAGHTKPVTALATLANAPTQLISGSEDASLRHWETSNGQSVRQMTHGGPVTAVGVRPDGQRFASASSNNTVRVWNAGNGQQVAELRGDLRIRTEVGIRQRDLNVASSLLATAKNALAAAEKDAPPKAEAAKQAVTAKGAAQKDYDEKLAAAKKTGEAKSAAEKVSTDAASLAQKATEAKAAADKLATDTATAAKQAADAKAAADKLIAQVTSELQKATAARDAADQAVRKVEPEAKAAAAKAVADRKAADANKSDAKLAQAAAAAEKLAAESNAKAKQAADAKVAADKALAQVDAKAKAAKDKGAEAAKGAADADAKAKQAADGKAKAEKALADAQRQAKEAADKLAAATKPAEDAEKARAESEAKLKAAERDLAIKESDAKRAAEAVPQTKTQLAETETRQKNADGALKASQKALSDSEKPLYALAYSPDGQFLAGAGESGLLYLYNARSGENNLAGVDAEVDVLAVPGGPIRALAFGPAGKIVCAAANQTAAVLDLEVPWKLERSIGKFDDPKTFADRVISLAFSPDGQMLATGGGEPSRTGEVKIWKVADGTLIRELPDAHSDTVAGLEFSPDAKYLATAACDKFVKTFEVASGKFIRSFEGHTHHVLGVSWQADGRVLASCGADNVVKVWNFDTGEQQRTVTGFNKQVTSVRFIGDSPNLICASADKTVTVKNSANGGNVRAFAGATDFVYAADSTADNKLVVAGGFEGVLRVWNGTNGQSIWNLDPPQVPSASGKDQAAR